MKDKHLQWLEEHNADEHGLSRAEVSKLIEAVRVAQSGQQAFVVVLKRVRGDTPKIEKVSGMLHLTREDAEDALAEIPEGIERNAHEVREISVVFLSKKEDA